MIRHLVIFFSFIFCALLSSAQNPVYVVFTSNDLQTDFSTVNFPVPDYDKSESRDQPHMFRLRNRPVKFFRTFYYDNRKDCPDNPPIVKPVSYLDTVEYCDWDKLCPDLTLGEAKALMDEWWEKQVYFIDRREIKDGMMRMYPVREMRSNY